MTATQQLVPAEELAGRLFESAVAGIDVLSVYLGDILGYYRALAANGGMNAAALAAKTGTHPRYAREWLEQQAISNLIAVDDPGLPAAARTYSLPEGYEAVLVDENSEAFVLPLGRFLKVMGANAERLVAAYRTGGGMTWGEMGEDARAAQAAFNRPFYLNSLVDGYLKQIEGLDSALSRTGSRVAEIGPGGGWALIAIASAYPGLACDGFDLDGPTVAMANNNVAAAGLDGRIAIHEQDAAAARFQGQYDLVCAFECLHDMPDPVGVLRTMRTMARPDGTVLVMDEAVAEEFGAFGDPVERLMYGASLFVCLPDGMSVQPTAATGTVMRPSTVRSYATQAGFASVEVLPLQHPTFRFYRLHL